MEIKEFQGIPLHFLLAKIRQPRHLTLQSFFLRHLESSVCRPLQECTPDEFVEV